MSAKRSLITASVLLFATQTLMAQNAPRGTMGGSPLGGSMGSAPRGITGISGRIVSAPRGTGLGGDTSAVKPGADTDVSIKDQTAKESQLDRRKKLAEAQRKRYAAQRAMQEKNMLIEQNVNQSMQIQQQRAYMIQQQQANQALSQQLRQPRVSTSVGDFGGDNIYMRQSVTDAYGNRATAYGSMPRSQYNQIQQQQFNQYMLNGGIDPRTGTKWVP